MAILAFQKPDKVVMLEANNFYGKFEFKPLEPGYGITVGNALRRVLLSSLEGYAISAIKIDGVKHEFDTIPGVKEDVTNIILNLKKVDLKQVTEDAETEKAAITVSGQEVFKAGDMDRASKSPILRRSSVIWIPARASTSKSRSTKGEAGFRPMRIRSRSRISTLWLSTRSILRSRT